VGLPFGSCSFYLASPYNVSRFVSLSLPTLLKALFSNFLPPIKQSSSWRCIELLKNLLTPATSGWPVPLAIDQFDKWKARGTVRNSDWMAQSRKSQASKRR